MKLILYIVILLSVFILRALSAIAISSIRSDDPKF